MITRIIKHLFSSRLSSHKTCSRIKFFFRREIVRKPEEIVSKVSIGLEIERPK